MKYSETIQNSLIEILKKCEEEDVYIRQRMLRECKQLELYWHGFQQIFWDERVQDFRIPTHDVMEQSSSREEVKFIYDYVVNIFKAHGLSIIAALSADILSVPFSPSDPDNTKDFVAARKAEKLGKLIQRKNKSKLLFYHALFTLYTNYFVACYNCYERDKKHGQVDIPKYKTEKSPDTYQCPDGECGFSSDTELINCPNCSSPLQQNPGEDQVIQDGTETVNKGYEKLAVFGTLNVKVSTYAADQEAFGYLIHYSDQHYAWLRNNFKDVPREKINATAVDNFERIARMPSVGRMYSDTYTQSLPTLKRVWLRPWMFDMLDEVEAKELHDTFPDGVYFAVINEDVFAEAREECLDHHWTVTKGDLSRAVHGDPLGKTLLPLQDLKNNTINLLVESLEHSVPSTWADPEILDFDTYSKQEVEPGSIYPIKNSLINTSKGLQDYFYSLKTSTLPKEGVDFNSLIDNEGQFVVGAFPSIFGGPQTEGSKTLGEYQESRNYALQRLSIPYQLLSYWWAEIIHKSVLDHIDNMVADEKHSMEIDTGKYVGISILMEDFKSGRFEALISESAPDLPVSFSQKRGTIQSILQLNNEFMNQFLFSPENRRITLRYLGMEELSDLDSNQTLKQLLEIDQLLKEEPIINPDQIKTCSIPIDPEIDDDEIHLRVIKTFATSEYGQEHKKDNPSGYENLLLHAKEHQNNIASMQMQQQQLNQPAGGEQNA